MTDRISFDAVREVLSLAFPMQDVIVVGAGRGQGLSDYHAASSRLLIEARADCIEVLKNCTRDLPGRTVLVQAVIAGQRGLAQFHVASNPDESSLIAPEVLQPLWRNLTTRNLDQVETSTLPDLLARLELIEEFCCNWLAVDCLPALPLLQAAGQLIDNVDVLEVRCVRDPAIGSGQGVSLESITQWLEPLGFRLVIEIEEAHPQLSKVVFCRDSMALRNQVAGLQESILTLRASHDESLCLIKAERDALQTQLNASLKQLQGLQDEARLLAGIQCLAEQLSAQNTELTKQLAKQDADLVLLKTQLLAAVKKEVHNGTQQLEAFLDIQNFFKHGDQLPGMHGWPVSPDFVRYLIRVLKRNDYDLILEFGSGTSTVIIARTLAQLDRTRHGKPPVLQVAFEHLEKFHDQTRRDLEDAGLAQSVDLILAPLEPYQPPNGNTYAYYTCHEKLADLSIRLPATSVRILLVVDGPPGNTGPHARYPALPSVLEHLRGKHLDILLDDYARPDEIEIAALWEKDLRQVGYKLLAEKINLEKGGLFMSASPECRLL